MRRLVQGKKGFERQHPRFFVRDIRIMHCSADEDSPAPVLGPKVFPRPLRDFKVFRIVSHLAQKNEEGWGTIARASGRIYDLTRSRPPTTRERAILSLLSHQP